MGLHDDEGLDQTFAEITDPARDCRFADSAQIGEPGCALLAAVEDGYLTQRRFDSYHRLQRPMKHGARLRRALKQSPHFKA
ncbi:hypothetical protein [Dactylosporangium sp. NPDC006015]|uniref:hypothetical protein n=1 Tax=Dactylosporangium sp. NPDC006015 TaxID=3154576 RepID=UPI0033B24BA1